MIQQCVCLTSSQGSQDADSHRDKIVSAKLTRKSSIHHCCHNNYLPELYKQHTTASCSWNNSLILADVNLVNECARICGKAIQSLAAGQVQAAEETTEPEKL